MESEQDRQWHENQAAINRQLDEIREINCRQVRRTSLSASHLWRPDGQAAWLRR